MKRPLYNGPYPFWRYTCFVIAMYWMAFVDRLPRPLWATFVMLLSIVVNGYLIWRIWF